LPDSSNGEVKPDLPIAGTKDGVEERIKRASRAMCLALSPDLKRLKSSEILLRNLAAFYQDAANERVRYIRKRQRQDPNWKRDRPKGAQIKFVELKVKDAVGRDIRKIERVEVLARLMPDIVAGTIDVQDPETIRLLESLVSPETYRLFMSKKPGRHKLDVFGEAYPRWIAGEKIDSLARYYWPDLHAKNRAQAYNRMKSGLHRRHKSAAQHSNQTASTPQS
jgi:hypothetical protein